jgi:hypothetical protein
VSSTWGIRERGRREVGGDSDVEIYKQGYKVLIHCCRSTPALVVST